MSTATAALTAMPPPPVSAHRAAFNEMRHGQVLNPGYRPIDHWLRNTSGGMLERKRRESDSLFRRRGTTFAVYGDQTGAERLIPFDIIPRVLTKAEWEVVSRGCIQRVRALNAFLDDVYNEQEILKAGVIPSAEVLTNACYTPQAEGLRLAHRVHAHIAGIDVVRTAPDTWYVLEDNLRTPSGVSYMLENRAAMRRLFPELFSGQAVEAIDHYPDLLLKHLREIAPAGEDDPQVVVLTPGLANSAYFEHAFLAQRMGVPLVEGNDLAVIDDAVVLKDTAGVRPVHVIYRRIDDAFLDPESFNKDSVLGVPGLLRAVRAGRVSLANAVGNGVADDKATYLRVPEMIRFYLGEQPILQNVPTWRCSDRSDRAYVLDHLAEVVVKEVHGSGGYGMLIGPTSSTAQREDFRQRILADPAKYIAQPTLSLSTCPTFTAAGVAPRHVDLRPYVLSGKTISLVPGALTRVALKEGSLVVNSSQGGGTKDTWVLA
jgi:uncharacterized circularly permuted ATP-grasp superfamily protein